MAILSKTLRPVKAFKCPKLDSYAERSLAEITECEVCGHCAEIRRPWHKFAVRCVWPHAGIDYYREMFPEGDQAERMRNKAMGRPAHD